MSTLWLDLSIGGLSPWLFHLTNLLWIAAAAALVVILIQRYTDDTHLALISGLIFVGHPFHVENAAWVGARSDPVLALPFLLAALFYDRWRVRAKGPPFFALMFFEAALLAKETAVTLPLLLLLIGQVDRRRRADRREWLKGFLPFIVLAGVHFFLIRPWVLGGLGRTLKEGFGLEWLKNGLGLSTAAILPFDVESLAAEPFVYGVLALLSTIFLLLIARLRAGRVPLHASIAAAAFAILVLPYMVGFQERYLFLPVAASSLFLASLIRAARGWLAVILFALLAGGWVCGSVSQWNGWFDAAVASRRLVDDLVGISRKGGVEEIVVANMPLRVHGGSVAGDLRAALSLSGGRPLPVKAAAYISYPTADADFLSGPPDISIHRSPTYAEVRLRIREGPFCHLVWPRPDPGETVAGMGSAITVSRDGEVQIRIFPDAKGGRAAFVWRRGHLESLFD